MSKAAEKNGSKNGDPALENEAPAPFRCAAVDVGSNAMRLLAAEFEGPASFFVLESHRIPVRLGHEVFLTGRLSLKIMERALGGLASFRAKLDELDIPHCRAVATSAVRESRNGEEFLERAEREAGIALEPITGSEEARLVHLAVKNRMSLGQGQWIMADLGGGSVEVSLADDAGILWTESHTMGSVRLLEVLAGQEEEPGGFLRLLEEYTATLRIPSTEGDGPIAGYIATGGNIETIADLAGIKSGGSVARVPLSGLRSLIERLAQLPFRERVETLGLREDRADVILPAAMVYLRLGAMVGASEIHVPGVGVKEGVLLDLGGRLAPRPGEDDPRIRQTLQSSLALGRRYRFDEDHGIYVKDLALSLFDQMTSLHGLGTDDRRILLAAAMLHDVGSFISRQGHHKHSQYILSHSELPGFSTREIAMTAIVARYHRKGPPRGEHHAFTALAKPERDRVLKLSSILRLADAMDKEHLQRIRGVRVKIKKHSIVLVLSGEGDILLESWAIKRKADLFRKVFDREVQIKE